MNNSRLPCVVHLVRHGNPLESFERFIRSYRQYEAGVEHRLILLCKGFPSEAALAPILERLDGVRAEQLDVPDHGFDLTAYRHTAARLDGAIGCYLNSNSVLLAAGWLERLLEALSGSVGIVGATGSWSSVSSSMFYSLRLPGAYRRVFPDREWHRAQSLRLNHDASTEQSTSVRPHSPLLRARTALLSHPPLRYARTAYLVGSHVALFRPFPAHHVRTNAIAIRSDTMLRLRFGRLSNKLRAWQLESGRGCITDQIAAMGLQTLVVGRDGHGYGPSEWADSDTFWQVDQDNLLVADNQTERYRLGDLELRTLLSKGAWGPQARPAMSPVGG